MSADADVNFVAFLILVRGFLLAMKVMLSFVIVCDALILVQKEQKLRCDEECTDILLSPVQTVQTDLMQFARCDAGNL